MKLAMIGFGAAAIGLLEKIKHSDIEIHVFEKSKDIYSSSISGIRADGKLFVSKGMGGDIDIDIDIQKKLVDFYINQIDNRTVETGKSFYNPKFYEKFYSKGFDPVLSDFYHIGTDQLKGVLYNIYEDFNNHKNIHFHFNKKITNIDVSEDEKIIVNEEIFDKVIVGVGRSGHKLVDKISKEHKGLILDNSKMDLGIRYEIPNHVVAELNKEMYEFKVRYKSVTGYTVRTFCNNPSGYVVRENYGDF
ncbi:MAG: NAD(P)/FAD-dependent oxidoreductase, partial [Candidatus Cloacimonadota bacterium]|nr:NAD(P)/FAD-dependent oxidoreductase [Candidatus Cloacimonadota bacterium]